MFAEAKNEDAMKRICGKAKERVSHSRFYSFSHTHVYLCSFLAFYLLVTSFSSLGVAAVASSEASYGELRDLYNKSQYAECIKKADDALAASEKRLAEARDFQAIAKLYEVKADCLERQKAYEASTETLQEMLTRFGKSLSSESRASFTLKVGIIYERGGFYSKAIRAFDKAIEEYQKVPSDLFVKYARDRRDAIVSKQVSVIKGIISTGEKGSSIGTTVMLFNGFEKSETRVQQKDGKFSVPLYSSTPGTEVAVMAYKEGYGPSIKIMRFDGSSSMNAGDMSMSATLKKGCGIIAGVVYTPVSGGKIRPLHGMTVFRDTYRIGIDRMTENGITAATTLMSQGGIFATALEKGNYIANDGEKNRIVSVKENGTVILNVRAGQVLVD